MNLPDKIVNDAPHFGNAPCLPASGRAASAAGCGAGPVVRKRRLPIRRMALIVIGFAGEQWRAGAHLPKHRGRDGQGRGIHGPGLHSGIRA